MTGKELKSLRERILMSRESLGSLLGTTAHVVRAWESREGELMTSTPEDVVLDALAWVADCMEPQDALKFGRSVDAWRLSKGVGFAVYCILRLQFGEDGCDVGVDAE